RQWGAVRGSWRAMDHVADCERYGATGLASTVAQRSVQLLGSENDNDDPLSGTVSYTARPTALRSGVTTTMSSAGDTRAEPSRAALARAALRDNGILRLQSSRVTRNALTGTPVSMANSLA